MQSTGKSALSQLTGPVTTFAQSFVLAQRPHSVSVWLSVARTQCQTDASSDLICEPWTDPDAISAQLENTFQEVQFLYQQAILDTSSDSRSCDDDSSLSSSSKLKDADCYSELEVILCSLPLLLSMLPSVTDAPSLNMSPLNSILVHCVHHLASCLLRKEVQHHRLVKVLLSWSLLSYS